MILNLYKYNNKKIKKNLPSTYLKDNDLASDHANYCSNLGAVLIAVLETWRLSLKKKKEFRAEVLWQAGGWEEVGGGGSGLGGGWGG